MIFFILWITAMIGLFIWGFSSLNRINKQREDYFKLYAREWQDEQED